MTPREAIYNENREALATSLALIALDGLTAAGFAIYRPDECRTGLVTGTSDGPRYDHAHPMNAPYGAWVTMTMDDNEAPALGRYRLVHAGEAPNAH